MIATSTLRNPVPAIPSGIVRCVYQQIRQHGRVRRGDIGADVQTLTPALPPPVVHECAPAVAGIDSGICLNEDHRAFGVNRPEHSAHQSHAHTVLETLRVADGKNKLALAELAILRKRHCGQAFGIDL